MKEMQAVMKRWGRIGLAMALLIGGTAGCGGGDRTLVGSNIRIHSVALSPDGTRVAVGGTSVGQIGTRGFFTLNAYQNGQLIRSSNPDVQEVYAVAFSPDGTKLATGCSDRRLRMWDVQTGNLLWSVFVNGWRFAFLPDGNTLITAGRDDRTYKQWDTQTGALIRTVGTSAGEPTNVAISPDGHTLAGAVGNTVELWNLAAGTLRATLTGHTDVIYGLAFAPDNQRLASSSADHTVRVWSVPLAQPVFTLTGQSDEVYSVAYSPNGSTLASAGRDRVVVLYNAQTGQRTFILDEDAALLESVTFTPDNQFVAAGSWDGFVRFWNAQTGAYQRTL